ncbi:MAG: ROK family transcriptional regulator [Albidovulum sp.]|nr:ROK family transcriptional regulator [Albidovulum sp.]
MNLGRKGLSIGNVQEFNRRVILSAMQEFGPCSRKDISVASGLDQATVTRAISLLIEDGIVEEIGFVKGGRGRRSIRLSFACSGRFIVCVRLQRRSFSVGLYSLAGETLEESEGRITTGQPPAATFDRIAARVDRLAALNPKIDGMGVAVPGPFLERDERVILMTESPDWQAFDLVRSLRERYSSIPVYSIHDAKAAALTVWRTQAKPSGAKVLLYVSAGQGIGSALVTNGEVYRGSLGLAGELGHTSIDVNGPRCKCGNHGCLELFSSRIALLRNVREYADGNPDTALTSESRFADVVEAYHAGDMLAVAEVDRVARYLAQGITNCVNFANPDIVVIGDEYTAFGPPFRGAIAKYVKASLLPSIYQTVRLELSQIEGDLVLKGTYLDVLSQTYLTAPREEAAGYEKAAGAVR